MKKSCILYVLSAIFVSICSFLNRKDLPSRFVLSRLRKNDRRV